MLANKIFSQKCRLLSISWTHWGMELWRHKRDFKEWKLSHFVYQSYSAEDHHSFNEIQKDTNARRCICNFIRSDLWRGMNIKLSHITIPTCMHYFTLMLQVYEKLNIYVYIILTWMFQYLYCFRHFRWNHTEQTKRFQATKQALHQMPSIKLIVIKLTILTSSYCFVFASIIRWKGSNIRSCASTGKLNSHSNESEWVMPGLFLLYTRPACRMFFDLWLNYIRISH